MTDSAVLSAPPADSHNFTDTLVLDGPPPAEEYARSVETGSPDADSPDANAPGSHDTPAPVAHPGDATADVREDPPASVEVVTPLPDPPAPAERPAPEPAATEPKTGFAALGLSDHLLGVLAEKGYEEPTPVQAAVIPAILAGRDVLGRAATGTGKTAAFALPLIDRLLSRTDADRTDDEDADRPAGPRVLVLVPTRELAAQVAEAVRDYAVGTGLGVVTVVGGEAFGPQRRALRQGVEMVVATPGRALDLIRRGTLQLAGLDAAVLDEADEMLDMGFADDIESVLSETPAGRQTVLVSATLPPRIKSIADKHMTDPVRLEVADPERDSDEPPRVRHVAHVVHRRDRSAALLRVLEAGGASRALIFCRTRGGVDDLTADLTREGRRAAALHGGLTQEQRVRVVERLRSGSIEVMVATDVAARGLDVPELTHVVNFDPPGSPETFVHRVGRVGRAGREGTAVTLLAPNERRRVRQFASAAGGPIPIEPLPTAADLADVREAQTRGALLDALTGDGFATLRDRLRPLVKALAAEVGDDFSAEDLAVAAAALAHHTAFGDPVTEDIPDAGGRPDRSGGPRSGGGDRGDRPDRGTRRGPRAKKDRGPRNAPADTARLFFSVGRDANVRPGDLVGAITGEAGIDGSEIGKIDVAPTFSLVDVARPHADRVISALRGRSIRGKKVTVRPDRGA